MLLLSPFVVVVEVGLGFSEHMKPANQELGVGDVLRRFSTVVLGFVSYPLDSVLQLASMDAGVQNVFHFELFFSADFNVRRGVTL